ncbi:hypothetical protein SAMN05421504_105395 [Amycolatopsis xylanica]|uniref:Uncharacterized protein n=1 Tax=Amycolatopsis xylanica TaxID=589385 RepID=A0A1H3JFV6_9PSEU|nr:hypothetical protein [Amycolatopsis xylanica]SDY38910.1 hypothetical protein SAMN05421504_105395 [Amycolatopsis xylanica]
MESQLQWVRTSWTKASRGGAGAARRNAVPVAFPVPGGQPAHEVLMNERDGFEPRMSMGATLPADVMLQEEDGLLHVQLLASALGQPFRRYRPPPVRLAKGEWLRWRINYRFVGFCDGSWSYRLDTLNVVAAATAGDLFLGKPTHLIDERVRLA